MAGSRITPAQQERLHQLIRRAGGRLTVPTRTVVDVLACSERHLTADDVISEVEARVAGIAPSTIYRVLQRLDELSVVEHVHSGTGPTFYHLREQGHAHLVCNSCGTIIDLPDEAFAPLAQSLRETYRFTVEPHHAALLGRCSRCTST